MLIQWIKKIIGIHEHSYEFYTDGKIFDSFGTKDDFHVELYHIYICSDRKCLQTKKNKSMRLRKQAIVQAQKRANELKRPVQVYQTEKGEWFVFECWPCERINPDPVLIGTINSKPEKIIAPGIKEANEQANKRLAELNKRKTELTSLDKRISEAIEIITAIAEQRGNLKMNNILDNLISKLKEYQHKIPIGQNPFQSGRWDGVEEAIKIVEDYIFNFPKEEAKASSTLRDQFALAAPPVPEWYTNQSPHDYEQDTADWPWYYADLVLATRKVLAEKDKE